MVLKVPTPPAQLSFSMVTAAPSLSERTSSVWSFGSIAPRDGYGNRPADCE